MSDLSADSLAQLLTDYRRDGVDSEGHFTLNPQRARELLEQYQLPEPAHYALHLASFLIGTGASIISIGETAGAPLDFRAEGGRPIGRRKLENPFSALLANRVEPYLTELALGLNSALAQGAEIQVRHGTLEAHYSSTEISLEDDLSPAPAGLCIKLLGLPQKIDDRAAELLAEHFAHSPIPIKLLGVTLGASPAKRRSKDALHVVLKHPEHPLPPLPTPAVTVSRHVQAPLSAVVMLGHESSGARIVCLGRQYTMPVPWSCQLPGWSVEVVLSTDRFHKDLSQQTIRQDALFNNAFATLRQQLEASLDDLPLPEAANPEAQRLWDDVVEVMFAQGRKTEALERQQRLVNRQQNQPLGFEQAYALFRLGCIEESLSPGSGQPKLHLARRQLSAYPDAEFGLTIARMAFAPYSADLEKSVVAMSKDKKCVPYDRLACFRWLRKHAQKSGVSPRSTSFSMAQQMQRLGHYGLALEELQAAQDGPPSDDPVLLIQEMELKANLLAELGRWEKAFESFGHLLALLRDSHGQYSLKLGLTLARLTALLEHLGKDAQAQEYRQWSQRLHT